MKNISFFKKIKLFFTYRKIILSLKSQLQLDFSARIDNAYRIYTVINIPEEFIEEPYNLRKNDIDNLAKNSLREYSNKLAFFLDSKGLMELYDFYEVEKVEKYSYLLIFGFSLFNTQKVFRNLLIIYLPLIVFISVLLFFLINFQ